MSDSTDHYEGALLEEIRDEVKAIHESLAPMPTLCRDVAQLKDDMNEVKSHLTNVETGVADLSKNHCQIDRRVSTLEKAAA